MNSEIESILELTRKVSALAEQGEWAQASQVDLERQARLRAYCAGLDPNNAPSGLIEALTQVLKLNDTLIGAIRHRQRSLARDAEMVRTGQRAVAAYGAAGSSAGR